MKKLIIALAALAMMASSAYAAEWNFYGNARVWTFYEDVENRNTGTSAKNTDWSVSPFSRIGANVKVSDELSGRFEYGASSSVNLRLLYGEWNFGAGSLRIGQDWVPTSLPGSNQVWGGNGLGGFGEAGAGRTGQIKLIMGGLRVALASPSTTITTARANGLAVGAAAVATGAAADKEVKLPQIAAKYLLSGDNWNARAIGAYQTYDYLDQSVTSYMVGIGADVTFGAFTLNAEIHGGENLGNLYNGVTGNGIAEDAAGDGVESVAYYDGTKVIDNQGIAYRIVGVYTMNDMLSFEIGFGAAENEYDAAGEVADKVESYYINMPIVVAPGVTITPEIGVLDYKEDNQSKTNYYGAHWRIDF